MKMHTHMYLASSKILYWVFSLEGAPMIRDNKKSLAEQSSDTSPAKMLFDQFRTVAI